MTYEFILSPCDPALSHKALLTTAMGVIGHPTRIEIATGVTARWHRVRAGLA